MALIHDVENLRNNEVAYVTLHDTKAFDRVLYDMVHNLHWKTGRPSKEVLDFWRRFI